MMVSIKGAITKPLPQRRAHRKMEGKQERRNRDFLKEGNNQLHAFMKIYLDRNSNTSMVVDFDIFIASK